MPKVYQKTYETIPSRKVYFESDGYADTYYAVELGAIQPDWWLIERPGPKDRVRVTIKLELLEAAEGSQEVEEND